MRCEQVLQDVERCLEWLEEEDDEFRFRMALLSSLALVRTVGHVLKKVDAAHNSAIAEAVSQRYEDWKRDRAKARIFWEFIDAERNSILKEYDWRFDFAPVLTTTECEAAWRIGSDLYCPVAQGAYEGEDVRDVLRDAASWWRAELGLIRQIAILEDEPTTRAALT